MKHDQDQANCGCYLMSYCPGKSGQWSHCSKANFLAHYNHYKRNWCMQGNSYSYSKLIDKVDTVYFSAYPSACNSMG